MDICRIPSSKTSQHFIFVNLKNGENLLVIHHSCRMYDTEVPNETFLDANISKQGVHLQFIYSFGPSAFGFPHLHRLHVIFTDNYSQTLV